MRAAATTRRAARTSAGAEAADAAAAGAEVPSGEPRAAGRSVEAPGEDVCGRDLHDHRVGDRQRGLARILRVLRVEVLAGAREGGAAAHELRDTLGKPRSFDRHVTLTVNCAP